MDGHSQYLNSLFKKDDGYRDAIKQILIKTKAPIKQLPLIISVNKIRKQSELYIRV